MRTVTQLLAVLALLLALTGCATQWGQAGMSAEEIKEFAKIRDAGLTCVRAVHAGSLMTIVTVNADRGVPTGMSVDGECKVTFNSLFPPK